MANVVNVANVANVAGETATQEERQERAFHPGAVPGGAAIKTRIAFLATLGHLHTEAVKYDLACLRSLVTDLEPDLLGIEVEPADWEQSTLSGAPVEVREALVPACVVTDTVVVPLGGPMPMELASPGAFDDFDAFSVPGASGRDLRTAGAGGTHGTKWDELRAKVLREADRLLTGWQRDRAAQGPEAVNSRAFGHLCGLVCTLEEAAAGEAGRRAWEESNERILERLVEMVRRDPGRRVLVAVNCRRVHWLQARLRAFAGEMVLVPYEQL